MSSQQTSTPAISKAMAKAAATGMPRFGTDTALIAGTMALGFVLLFFSWLKRQFWIDGWSWGHSADWGHAYLVPFISGYYIWRNRARFASLPRCVFWPGYAVLLLGIVCYVYFTVGYSNHMFQGFAMILALAGLVLLLMGPEVFRAAMFPIAYLGFTVTISQMVMDKATWELKLLASKGAWLMLNMVGVVTDISGNILTINTSDGKQIPLNVAEACSGMRMVVAFIALAVAVAFLSCDTWWKRVGVMMLAVPVALLMNIVRVAVLGVASLVNPELSVGEAHTLIGTVLLIPAFFLFMGGVWAMDQIFKPDPAPRAKGVVS